MIKPKITTKNLLQLDRYLKSIPDQFSKRQFRDKVAIILETMVKVKIDKGLSPVKGYRNFAKYKDPKKYPAGLKQSNKPNLKLEGDLMRDYKAYEHPTANAVTVGIHNSASELSKQKAQTHNFGNSKLGVVMRRFIPQGQDVFTQDVMNAIKKAIAEVLGIAIKQKGKGK